MTILIRTWLLLVMLMLLPTLTIAVQSNPINNLIHPMASYEFMQEASKAVLQPIPNAAGQYQLTLTGISATVHLFSDRPERLSGNIPLEKYISLWHQGNNSFKNNPPNVALSGVKRHAIFFKTQLSFVMELTNPQYNSKNASMTYDATIIDQQKPTETITLNNVSIFIDGSMCPSCCCG